MTLILTKFGGPFAIQVADRLLTRDRKTVFDSSANKSLIFLAADARVCMAWTGLAFLGRVPTDYVIAEEMQGQSIRFHDDSVPADEKRPVRTIRSGEIDNWPTLNTILERLCRRLSDAWERERPASRSLGLTVIGTGWVWNADFDQHPIGFHIAPDINGRFRVQWARDVGQEVMAFRSSGYISSEECEEMGQWLANKPAADAESHLVSRLREEADANAVVGHDCMSIVIPDNGDIVATFHPADPNTLESKEIRVGQRTLAISPWYSPWLITPHHFSPPLELVGANPQIVEVDGLKVQWRTVVPDQQRNSTVLFHSWGATRRHLEP